MAIELITCAACSAKNAASRTVCLSCGADLDSAKGSSGREAVQSAHQSLWERVKQIAKNLMVEETGKGKLKKILAREWLVVVSGFLFCEILTWIIVISWWLVAPRETTDLYTVFGENMFYTSENAVFQVTTNMGTFKITIPPYQLRIQRTGLQDYLEGLFLK